VRGLELKKKKKSPDDAGMPLAIFLVVKVSTHKTAAKQKGRAQNKGWGGGQASIAVCAVKGQLNIKR